MGATVVVGRAVGRVVLGVVVIEGAAVVGVVVVAVVGRAVDRAIATRGVVAAVVTGPELLVEPTVAAVVTGAEVVLEPTVAAVVTGAEVALEPTVTVEELTETGVDVVLGVEGASSEHSTGNSSGHAEPSVGWKQVLVLLESV